METEPTLTVEALFSLNMLAIITFVLAVLAGAWRQKWICIEHKADNEFVNALNKLPIWENKLVQIASWIVVALTSVVSSLIFAFSLKALGLPAWPFFFGVILTIRWMVSGYIGVSLGEKHIAARRKEDAPQSNTVTGENLFEKTEAQGTQGEKSGESIEEAIILDAKNDGKQNEPRVFPQGKPIENKTLFSIEDIAELRRRAQEADNPMALLDVFTSLRIKKELTLRAFPYSVPTGSVGNVWAVPLSVPLRGSEAWEMIDLWEMPRPFPIDNSCLDGLGDPGELIIPRPPGALNNIMEAIKGNGTLWSYLSASIFAREVAEFGASWHGLVWSTHTILGGDPWACPHDWGELEIKPSSEKDWVWSGHKPSEWSPLVVQDGEVITVKFYTFSALVQEVIYCYTDTYKPNNYTFESDVEIIAEGPASVIF